MSTHEDKPTTQSTDWQLLDDYVKHSSAAAFRELVLRHGQLVYTSCHRILGNQSLAEEAAQDAFILLASKARNLDRKTAIAGWLHRAGWNICRMRRRSEARRLQRESSDQVADWHVETTNEIWHDLKPVLDDALSQLSAKFRDVIVLCYLEGIPQKQAASQLNCSEGAVSKRLKKGIEQLRRLMSPARSSLSSVALIAALRENSLEACDNALLERIAAGGFQGTASLISIELGGPVTHYLGISSTTWICGSLACLAIAGIALLWSHRLHPNDEPASPSAFHEPNPSQKTSRTQTPLTNSPPTAAPRIDSFATQIERSLASAFFATHQADRERILKNIGIALDSRAIEAVSANCNWANFENGLLLAWAKKDPLAAVEWRLAYSRDISFLLEDWIEREADSALAFLNSARANALPYRDQYLTSVGLKVAPLETRDTILEAHSGAERERMLALLARAWPEERLDEATPWAAAMLADPSSWRAFSEALLLRFAPNAPSSAIELLPLLNDSLSYSQTARKLAREISAHQPDQTIELYDQLARPIRLEVAYPTAQGMAEVDFELAYAWTQTLPTRERHQAFLGLMSIANPEELQGMVERFLKTADDPLMTSSLLDALGNNRRFPEQAAAYALLMLDNSPHLLDSPFQRQRALSAAMGVVGNLTLKGSFKNAAIFLEQLPFNPETEKLPLAERLVSSWSIVEGSQAIEWIQSVSWSPETQRELTAQARKIDALFAPYR